MYTTKDTASAAGEMFYMTNRPCRRGHLAARYTSSGNCVQCVADKAKQNKIKTKAIRRIRHAKQFGDKELYAATFPIQLHPILDRMQAIFQGTDVVLQHNIIGIINGSPVAWDRNTFINAGVLWNGQHITNAAKFPVGNPFAIKIGNIWWPGAQLMAVLRGEVSTIEPCDYIPQLEV